MSVVEDCGFIYIMTNPVMPGLIKIGYATDAEKRRKELSHASGVPADFVIYATYAVPVKLADKKVHNLIIALNPTLKFNPKKEFFTMDPETAYKILEALASIHGRLDKLYRYMDGVPVAVSKETEDDVETDEIKEPVKVSDAISFDANILLAGGKSATNYLKEHLVKNGYVDSSWKITQAKLNKDGRRYWANPDVEFLKFNWCLVLNDNVKRKLYILKIPANTYSLKDVRTRIKDGKELINVAIVYQDGLFVCVESKINYTKWFVDEFNY